MSLPQVPFDDRGLAYGDGLFETVLVRYGEPLLWEYHMQRLRRGCQVLDMAEPSRESLDATLEEVQGELAVLKLVVTRGSGGRGYARPAIAQPRLLSHWTPFSTSPQRWREGVRVRVCHLRLGRQPRLAGIKHLNRLENVLARGEWDRVDIDEGLMADQNGQMIEATSMNLFWERNGSFFTSELDTCGVAGTLREALLADNRVSIAPLDVADIGGVDSLWLGNSIQGLWPVAELLDADNVPCRRWPSAQRNRELQTAAHQLLGYPVIATDV
ncbi:aminodeoxychorismate lyase [Halomonas sp. Bachu 37]|uniref:aminodeoxychorismate lyase n=1 Tax=Halomonas kashgarensis TaxID=3084920 RepID=UPI0032180ECA